MYSTINIANKIDYEEEKQIHYEQGMMMLEKLRHFSIAVINKQFYTNKLYRNDTYWIYACICCLIKYKGIVETRNTSEFHESYT